MDHGREDAAVIAGASGLVLLIVGAFVAGVPPRIEASTAVWIAHLGGHQGTVLLGIACSLLGGALLLLPLGVVVTRACDTAAHGLALAAFGGFILAFGISAIGSLAVAAVTWSHPAAVDPSIVRFAVDLDHLAQWALSAPAAGLAVVTMSIAAHAAGFVPRRVLVLGWIKVATVVVEVAGLWMTSGWNAGGYALGTSALATVAWLTSLLLAIRQHQPAPLP